MPELITSNITIIVGNRSQIGRVKVADHWYPHRPARLDRPFKSLSGIKRSITNEWNGDNHKYIAVITPCDDGTYEAHVARVIK